MSYDTFASIIIWTFFIVCICGTGSIIVGGIRSYQIAQTRKTSSLLKIIGAFILWLFFSLYILIVTFGYLAGDMVHIDGRTPTVKLETATIFVIVNELIYLLLGGALMFWANRQFAKTRKFN